MNHIHLKTSWNNSAHTLYTVKKIKIFMDCNPVLTGFSLTIQLELDYNPLDYNPVLTGFISSSIWIIIHLSGL